MSYAEWIDLDWRCYSLLPPNSIYERYGKELFDRLAANPVPWDEDKTKFQKALVIDAATWNPESCKLFNTPAQHFDPAGNIRDQYKYDPSGKFAYVNRILPGGSPLTLFQGRRVGKVGFTRDVIIPTLASAATLRPWMSYTPAEILSQRTAVKMATGNVLLGGLGMGYLLRKVAVKRSVEAVTVVEKSQELLDWYGTDLCRKIATVSGVPVTVICDDVLNHLGKHGSETRYLIDIWDSYPQSLSDLPKPFREAVKPLKHFWGWGIFHD